MTEDEDSPKKLIFDADENNLQVEMVYTTDLPPL